MAIHGADALYSSGNSVTHAIQMEDHDTQQDAAHMMIQMEKPRTMKRCSQSNLANEKLLVQLLKENAHLLDLEWTEDQQANQETRVERYTSRSASGAWRVPSWWLVCFPLA
jgi:hypothetical protein